MCFYSISEQFINSANFPDRPLLPDDVTKNMIYDTNKILIARVLVKHLPAFRLFAQRVCGHIKHPYQKEMGEKSEVVSIN